jgi:hypothetical protein
MKVAANYLKGFVRHFCLSFYMLFILYAKVLLYPSTFICYTLGEKAPVY